MPVETRVLNHICQQRLREAARDPRAKLYRQEIGKDYRIVASSPSNLGSVIYAAATRHCLDLAWREAEALWEELRKQEAANARSRHQRHL